jgi:hypothetical protein
LVYENITWSIYNPTGPISKAQLEADFASLGGASIAPLNLSTGQVNEVSAFSSLPETAGFVKKTGAATYILDANTYLTGIDFSAVTTALGYTPYSDTNPSLYASKSYVDGLVSGVVYKNPVTAINYIGESTSPIGSPYVNDSYLISTGGATGAWSSFAVDDVVQYQLTGWTKIGVASIGKRFGISLASPTSPLGDALGKGLYLGQITGGTSGAWTWAFEAPVVNWAVFSNNPLTGLFGHSYTYTSDLTWIEFSGPGVLVDGDGLTYTGNTLNVNAGAGLHIVSDNVALELYSGGGLMTTVDGTTSSSTSAAQLSLALVGTAGTYKLVTTDGYGRVTGGSNPTTLAGFGITDGVSTSLLGANNGIATLSATGKLTTSQTPVHNHPWTDLTGVPNTLAGFGIVDAQPLDSDLNAFAALSTNGIVARTATGAVATRTITGTTNQVDVANGDGIAGNPTIALAANPIIPGTAAISLPKGTTAQRSVTPTNGDARYNNTTGSFEFYQAGNWATYLSVSPGAGSIKQVISGAIASVSGNTVIPLGTVSPLVTAGTQIWAQTITPSSTLAKVAVSFTVTADASANNRTLLIAIFRGSVCIATIVNEIDTASHPKNMTLVFTDSPGSVSPITYSARMGIDNASATWYCNGTVAGNTMGGSLVSNYRLDEIS